MCIIGYFPPGVLPVRTHLEESVLANPHGFGWAIVTYDPQCPIIVGHTMDKTEAVETFMELRAQFPDNAALFHARITTHGKTSLENCHPFFVGGRNDIVLAHNGILPCTPIPGDQRSDTRILAESVLLHRFRHLDSAKTRRRFEDWMGASKVVILTTDRFYNFQSYLFNEGMGVWSEEGIWYSNDSYKPWRSSFKRGGAGWASDFEDGWYGRDPWYSGKPESTTLGRLDWSDDSEGFVMLHLPTRMEPLKGCGQDSKRCPCSGSRVFSPVNLSEQGDQAAYWRCAQCRHFGTIDSETLLCDMCGGCFACDREQRFCDCALLSTARGTTGLSAGQMAILMDALEEELEVVDADTLAVIGEHLALPAGPSAIVG